MKRFIKSIVDNHCLPDNKVEVSHIHFWNLMLNLNFKFLVLGRLFHKECVFVCSSNTMTE